MICCIEHWENNLEAFHLASHEKRTKIPARRQDWKGGCLCSFSTGRLESGFLSVSAEGQRHFQLQSASRSLMWNAALQTFPKASDSGRNSSERNIYTHIHSKTLGLLLLGDTLTVPLTAVRAVASTPGLSSGGTVDAQRKALTPGRHTLFHP